MSTGDQQFAAFNAEFEARENSRSIDLLPLIRTPELRKGSAGADTTALHFILTFPRRGAAVLALTWALAALEALCAPVEEVDFAYSDAGGITATVYVGSGWAMPGGLHAFLSFLQKSPRVPAFEWVLDVLPNYTSIAALAVEDPERFEQIGEHLRADLIAGSRLHIPRVRCPCAYSRAACREDNSVDARARTTEVLQKLRDGWLRWRSGGDC